MKSAFYYPPASRLGYDNPYSISYKKALSAFFRVYDFQNKPAKMLTLRLLIYSFIADVFFVNWLESAPFLRMGWLQYRLACIALSIIKLRNKKIVWMLHNIHPHNGSNACSLCLQRRLFKDSSLIVAHSTEAFLFARENAKGKCLFFNHPVQQIKCTNVRERERNVDVLVWGCILPYKGVYEFISNSVIQNSGLKILVLGSCKDEILASKIESCCTDSIRFENRRASFEELHTIMQSCKYVVFPYVGNCVSSSGALIDTLVLGGTPVGPKVGAFADLNKLGVCLTYENFSDLSKILQTENTLSEDAKRSFFVQNSWDHFIQELVSNI